MTISPESNFNKTPAQIAMEKTDHLVDSKESKPLKSSVELAMEKTNKYLNESPEQKRAGTELAEANSHDRQESAQKIKELGDKFGLDVSESVKEVSQQAKDVNGNLKPEKNVEFKQQTPEEIKEGRRSEIIKELEKEWEDKHGPMEIPMTKEEIEKNKKMAEAFGEKWNGRTTKLTEAADEFYFDHKGMGKSSVPSRADKILVERFPEYTKKEISGLGGMIGGDDESVKEYLENERKAMQEISESGGLGGMFMAEKLKEESEKTEGNFNKSQADIAMEKADNIIKEDNELEILERERANEEFLALSEISIFCMVKMDKGNVENEFKKIMDSASKLKDGHPVKVALERTSNVKLADIKIRNLKEIGQFSSLYSGHALDTYEDEPFSKSNINKEFNELSREEAEKEFMLLNEISKICNGVKNNLNIEILSKKIGFNIDKLRVNHPVRNFYKRIMKSEFQGALSRNIEKLGKFSDTYSRLGLNTKRIN